jgi:hypothetical protein
MRRALERHETGEAVVIPIIVRPCDWNSAPFGRLSALPTDEEPITKWADLDDACLDITKGIRAVLSMRGAPANQIRPAVPIAPAARGTVARSSNLRVARTFSEREKDDFLRESFEFIERFFENSVTKLADRNPRNRGPVPTD